MVPPGLAVASFRTHLQWWDGLSEWCDCQPIKCLTMITVSVFLDWKKRLLKQSSPELHSCTQSTRHINGRNVLWWVNINMISVEWTSCCRRKCDTRCSTLLLFFRGFGAWLFAWRLVDDSMVSDAWLAFDPNPSPPPPNGLRSKSCLAQNRILPLTLSFRVSIQPFQALDSSISKHFGFLADGYLKFANSFSYILCSESDPQDVKISDLQEICYCGWNLLQARIRMTLTRASFFPDALKSKNKNLKAAMQSTGWMRTAINPVIAVCQIIIPKLMMLQQ